MLNYLSKMREPVPEWLMHCKQEQKPPLNQFLASRIVYYPACRCEGQPVRLFNQAQCAHCFLYVDYAVSKDELNEELSKDGFRGYHISCEYEYSMDDFMSVGIADGPCEVRFHRSIPTWDDKIGNSYCMLYIMERDKEYGDDFGAERFAFMFLYAEGIATYQALFGKTGISPFCLVLQNHGFGGEWEGLGRGHLLEQVADRYGVYPEYYLVSYDTTRPWENTIRVNVPPVVGGCYFIDRYLFEDAHPQK